MNFKELAAQVANNNALTKVQAEGIVKEIFDTIRDEISTEGEVSIHGFGRFTAKVAAPRIGRNPRTGEAVNIPKKIVPKFVAHTALKQAVL